MVFILPGYVPQNVIAKDNLMSRTRVNDEIYTISALSSYHGDILRKDAVTMLQTKPHGTYLFRSSHMGEFRFS